MHHHLWWISLPHLQREIALTFMQCVVPGNIHTPYRGHFCFSPQLEFIPGGVCQTPPWNFQLGLAPPEKTISVKNAVALYYYVKDDCPFYSR